MFLGLLGLFSSCSEQSEDPIIGKWDIQNAEAKDEFIIFSRTDDGQAFTEYGWYDDTIRGSWIKEDNQLTLNYVSPGNYNIDSIAISNNADGSAATSFYDGVHYGKKPYPT